MKKSIYSITIIIALFFIYGCATTKPLNTPSGKPDITIPNVNKKQVTDALVSQMINQGFSIKSSSDYNIVFIKPLDNFGAELLLGSNYDRTPEHRASFMLVESGDGIRIVLTNQAITNPGSAFEKVTDLSTGKSGQSWQDFLVSFKGIFVGRIGINVDKSGIITKIADGSPAMQSKLEVGDKIVSVNGEPYISDSQIRGEPETSVEIIVLRNGENITFNITRKILK
jgi:S1-C subfamily serine protease